MILIPFYRDMTMAYGPWNCTQAELHVKALKINLRLDLNLDFYKEIYNI